MVIKANAHEILSQALVRTVLKMIPNQLNSTNNSSNHYVSFKPKDTTEASQRKKSFNSNHHEENPNLYDFLKKFENSCFVPPALMPLDAAIFKPRYLKMTRPIQIENGNKITATLPPQSRQEFLSSLRKSLSIEYLPELEMKPPKPATTPTFATVDKLESVTSEQTEPKSSLIDIVNPLPLIVPKTEHRSSSPKHRLTTKFSEAQSQFCNGQITVSEAEFKFEELKSSLMYTVVEKADPEAVDKRMKQWEDIISQKDKVKYKLNKKSLYKKFSKFIK